jgi:hypothetical protein
MTVFAACGIRKASNFAAKLAPTTGKRETTANPLYTSIAHRCSRRRTERRCRMFPLSPDTSPWASPPRQPQLLSFFSSKVQLFLLALFSLRREGGRRWRRQPSAGGRGRGGGRRRRMVPRHLPSSSFPSSPRQSAGSLKAQRTILEDGLEKEPADSIVVTGALITTKENAALPSALSSIEMHMIFLKS